MIVKIKVKAISKYVDISVQSFKYAVDDKLYLYFVHLPDNTLQQLMSILGFQEAFANKACWHMNAKDVEWVSTNPI